MNVQNTIKKWERKIKLGENGRQLFLKRMDLYRAKRLARSTFSARSKTECCQNVIGWTWSIAKTPKYSLTFNKNKGRFTTSFFVLNQWRHFVKELTHLRFKYKTAWAKSLFFRRLFIAKYKSSHHIDYKGLFSLGSEVLLATIRVAIIKRVNKKKTCIQF